jgi:PKHD-type hydroxylase
MIFTIDEILSIEELDLVISKLNTADFVDGKTTAGWHASLVKHNSQLSKNTPKAQELTNIVKQALNRHLLFKMAVQPKSIHSMIFSRYTEGMSYGRHTDNAIMGQQQLARSDVSLTLFLTPPSSYEGGELVIEQMEGEQKYKLEAGSMVLYPSSTLHRVEPVTSGERLVVVAWVQSLVRDPGEREILFELDTVRRSIFQKEGKSTEFDLLSKTHANLLRKWADL